MKIPGSFLHQRPQPLLLAVTALVLLILRHFHACPLGKLTDCVGIAQSLYLHHKIDGTAALMAAEAVVDTLIGGNGEGGCLFSVEGAKAKHICAGTLQGYILAHHILYGIAGNQFIDKTWGECHIVRPPFAANRRRYFALIAFSLKRRRPSKARSDEVSVQYDFA